MPPSPAPKRLLVVEDNDVAREGLGVVLDREGYQVLLASNGQEALDLLRGTERPDLILLDMLLPVLDGWHFLQRLRREGPQPPIPVIITTATILTGEWARDNGCQGFVRKPFDTDLLLAEIGRCLRATSFSSSSRLE
jgi:CheY-like chemotaxis protein